MTKNAEPTISLCNADPNSPFMEDLADVWGRGTFTDAAVAFLTEGGVDFYARKCLSHQDRNRCRLCVAVQWPTDLDAVAQLSPLLGDNLRIHLGSKTPVELGTDITPMLHSKVVYTEHDQDTCTVFIGSHNWTGNALNGVNSEASVRVTCERNDPFASEVRSHLDECARQCVPFEPNDLAYYKAIQRELSTSRPPAPDAEKLNEFERIDGSPAVVIHAEGDSEQLRMDKLLLFLPIKQRAMAKWFSTTTPTTVFLFLYPRGALIGQTPPSSPPILFHGPVGTNNDVNVSPSRETDVTCEIRDFERPQLEQVVSGNIPPIEDELYQVVVELNLVGPAEVPVYHRGKHPSVQVAAQFSEYTEGVTLSVNDVPQISEDTEEATLSVTDAATLSEEIVGEYDLESRIEGVFLFQTPTPERVIHLDVPERWLYSHDVEDLVNSRLSRKHHHGNIRVALKPSKDARTYVYKATFLMRS